MTRISKFKYCVGLSALILGSCGSFLVATQNEINFLTFVVLNSCLLFLAGVVFSRRLNLRPLQPEHQGQNVDDLLMLLPSEVRGEIGIEVKQLISVSESRSPQSQSTSSNMTTNALIVQLGRHIKSQNDILLKHFTQLLASGSPKAPVPGTFGVSSEPMIDMANASLELRHLSSELAAMEDQMATDLAKYESSKF